MPDEVVVSSTTDTRGSVEKAAALSYGEEYEPQIDENVVVMDSEEAEAAGRAPVQEGPLGQFRESADGQTISYEHPQSERQTLLARLEAEVSDAVELTKDATLDAEPEAGTETPTPNLTPEQEKQMADLAFQEFIATKQRQIQQPGDPTAQQLAAEQARYQQRMQEATATYDSEMQKIKQRNPAEFAAAEARFLAERFPPVPEPIRAALASVEGGPQVGYYLMQNPDQYRELLKTGGYAATARIGQLAAQFAPRSRPISTAPAPIRPVGGSSTRSSLPLDQSDYQDFKRIRESQIRAKRGR